jgi:hypothetical protein
LVVLERARFRRALGEPEAALDALPLPQPRKQGLITRLQLSRRAQPTTDTRSELGRVARTDQWDPQAHFIAEAADILYAHGEHARAVELFDEAHRLDPEVGAVGALARWQLRAGESDAAASTIELLATQPDLAAEAMAVTRWCLHRQRWSDAGRILSELSSEGDAADEIATRLGRLDSISFAPMPAPKPPAADAVSRLSPSDGRAPGEDR